MTVYRIVVPGTPQPQGSLVRTKFGGLRSANKNLEPWRDSVRWRAIAAKNGGEILNGPVSVDILAVMARPKGHFGTGKNAGKVKPKAPLHHVSKPDSDKLARAILDSLSGTLIRDDSQVWRLNIRKIYGDEPRAEVIVEQNGGME